MDNLNKTFSEAFKDMAYRQMNNIQQQLNDLNKLGTPLADAMRSFDQNVSPSNALNRPLIYVLAKNYNDASNFFYEFNLHAAIPGQPCTENHDHAVYVKDEQWTRGRKFKNGDILVYMSNWHERNDANALSSALGEMHQRSGISANSVTGGLTTYSEDDFRAIRNNGDMSSQAKVNAEMVVMTQNGVPIGQVTDCKVEMNQRRSEIYTHDNTHLLDGLRELTMTAVVIITDQMASNLKGQYWRAYNSPDTSVPVHVIIDNETSKIEGEFHIRDISAERQPKLSRVKYSIDLVAAGPTITTHKDTSYIEEFRLPEVCTHGRTSPKWCSECSQPSLGSRVAKPTRQPRHRDGRRTFYGEPSGED